MTVPIDDEVRPLIQSTLALDELDDDARRREQRPDSSEALANVFVIVLAEDERRVDHFHKHLARRLPEAERFDAINAKKDAIGTAEELHRLRITLSESAHTW